MKRLLLISTSTQHGSGYLEHCAGQIKSFLGNVTRVLFVPYALDDMDGYAATARRAYEAMGFGLDSIHEATDPVAAVAGIRNRRETSSRLRRGWWPHVCR